jgi:MOSC domain-containing protein YiiM
LPEARVFQLNVSPGGVPKRAVARAALSPLGLEGDAVRNPDVHGGPDRALCLYALERILALQEEGHPVFPGALGENVTTVGLDFEGLAPGDRLALGPEALVEVVSYTAPCRTIAGSFHDRAYGRVSQKAHPGWSRVYARVLAAGTLEPGQAIRREAPARVA